LSRYGFSRLLKIESKRIREGGEGKTIHRKGSGFGKAWVEA